LFQEGNENMKKLLTIITVVAMMVVVAVNANAAVTVNLTEVDLGPSTQVDLTNQFASYGVTFDHMYRAIDGRDPWLENGPQNPLESPPTVGYSAFNGWVSENYQSGILGTIFFTQSTPYVTIDWWDIGTNVLYVDAYDASNNLIDSFIGSGLNGYGTETLSGISPISYMTCHDDGGFVAISNMTFESTVIPAPGAILLGSIGVAFVGWLRRRRTL
jgi:hypothetical protein